jgi:adenosine kinase
MLGLRPGARRARGPDFADYRSWLDRHGVDTESVHVSRCCHTARFVCTTDQHQPDRHLLRRRHGRPATSSSARGRPRRRGRPRAHRRQRPRGHAAPHRGVPDRGLPFVADPSPAAGPHARRGDPRSSTAPRTCSPTSTRPPSPSTRPGGPARRSLERVGSGVTTLGPKGRASSGGARSRPGPDAARRRTGRPDRRRRRLPGRVPRRAGVGSAAARAAPRSAPCWPPTSSRPSAPRSTRTVQAGLPRRLARSYGAEAAAEIEPHIWCCESRMP